MLGQRKETYDAYIPVKTPDSVTLAVKKGGQEGCMKMVGRFLKQVVKESRLLRSLDRVT
jgi:xylulose-5-phosphate/fructose-6-phosphate phosphoketolase